MKDRKIKLFFMSEGVWKQFDEAFKEYYKHFNMPKNYNPQREELSEEGKQLWDEMMGVVSDGDELKKVINTTARKISGQAQHVAIVDTEETKRLRLELRKLQQNSRIVISDCERLQKLFTQKEEYFKANECRVAAMCHQNFVNRIQSILDGKRAFSDQKLNDELEQGLSDTHVI